MKVLSRDFTRREKTILLILLIILLALAYYQFLWRPVKTGIEAAASETESLQTQVDILEAQLDRMTRMENELGDGVEHGYMPSYNNAQAVQDFLSETMQKANKFSDNLVGVSRNGDQIRRVYSFTFEAEDYFSACDIINQLADCEYRCQIGDLGLSVNTTTQAMSVSGRITFFETMVGGQEDSALPADTSR